MKSFFVGSILIVVLSACSTRECTNYNDCPDNSFCSIDGECVPAEGACEPGGSSDWFLPESTIEAATHLPCRFPKTTNPDGPFFTGYQGWPVVVTGGSLAGSLGLSGVNNLAGESILVGIKGQSSWHWVDVSDDAAPFPLELFVRPDAPGGNVVLLLAIDDGTGAVDDPHPGPVLEVDLRFIEVQSGDIQVSLSWNLPADVDLHILDPDGNPINFGQRTTPDGGELDLDSNAACSTSQDLRNENVYWPIGAAPSGEYKVWVNLWSDCEIPVTDWRLTAVVGETLLVDEGVLPAPPTPEFFGTSEVDLTAFPPTMTFTF